MHVLSHQKWNRNEKNFKGFYIMILMPFLHFLLRKTRLQSKIIHRTVNNIRKRHLKVTKCLRRTISKFLTCRGVFLTTFWPSTAISILCRAVGVDWRIFKGLFQFQQWSLLSTIHCSYLGSRFSRILNVNGFWDPEIRQTQLPASQKPSNGLILRESYVSSLIQGELV